MPQNSLLGKNATYVDTYAPHLLYPISRRLGRDKIPLQDPVPFQGVDLWNGSELSWLNLKGKPEIALAEFRFPALTPYIVESKSFKLYLNSFCQTPFESLQDVEQRLAHDLSRAVEGNVQVKLVSIRDHSLQKEQSFPGLCLDDLDLDIDCYHPNPSFLSVENIEVEESLYSHLLKSNCLATGQPDWGSILIRYKGNKIDHAGLLKYIISFRNHAGFGEHCVEQMFIDILTQCAPACLTVYGRYTRRGGLDINPFRSNFETCVENWRQPRQ